MKKSRGFALLDVLLAVILLSIVTIGSYSLVKSFRSTSAMQKLVRYATTITENYMPFLEGSVSTDVLSDNKLSAEFLESINIPDVDLRPTDCEYCYVKTGLQDSSGADLKMNFDTVTDTDTAANFFIIGFTTSVTAGEKNQMLQSLGGVFSLYCPDAACTLTSEDDSHDYEVKMVFPKAGSTIPGDSGSNSPVCLGCPPGW